MSTDNEPDEIEVETVDADEMIRRERIRGLFDARTEVRDTRLEVKQQSRGHETQAGNSIYRAALESYVREAQPLCTQTTAGQKLWNEKDFGSLTLEPPLVEYEGDTNAMRIEGTDTTVTTRPTPKKVDVVGLKSLFEISPPFVVDFEIQRGAVTAGPRVTTETVELDKSIPFYILDEMFAATNAYLAELGIGIDVQEGTNQTKVDDSLIEEVEKWRRENL